MHFEFFTKLAYLYTRRFYKNPNCPQIGYYESVGEIQTALKLRFESSGMKPNNPMVDAV